MEERKGFSDADFIELIKNEPDTLKKYKEDINDLFSRRIYSEDQVVKLYTGKTRDEVNRDYNVPQLLRLAWCMDFLMNNPCGDMYIDKLASLKKRK